MPFQPFGCIRACTGTAQTMRYRISISLFDKCRRNATPLNRPGYYGMNNIQYSTMKHVFGICRISIYLGYKTTSVRMMTYNIIHKISSLKIQ